MKKAILVVSFGTSYKETRKKTIEACETKIKQTFHDYEIYSAYTSKKIIEKIRMKEGIDIQTPMQVLDQLSQKCYDEVIVQPLYMIHGKEFDELAKQVERYRDRFKYLFLGTPLLASNERNDEVAEAIKDQIPTSYANEVILLVGHGSFKNSNECYKRLESYLNKQGLNIYIAVLEGEMTLTDVIKKLQMTDVTAIHLVPLMLVAGYHVVKDLMSESPSSWKAILEKEGFNVKVHLKALGENPKIQALFVQSVREGINKQLNE